MVRPTYWTSNKFFNSINEITRQNSQMHAVVCGVALYLFEANRSIAFEAFQSRFRGVQIYLQFNDLKIVEPHGNGKSWKQKLDVDILHQKSIKFIFRRHKKAIRTHKHTCLRMHTTQPYAIPAFHYFARAYICVACWSHFTSAGITNGTSWIIQMFCVRTANGPINKSLGFVDK